MPGLALRDQCSRRQRSSRAGAGTTLFGFRADEHAGARLDPGAHAAFRDCAFEANAAALGPAGGMRSDDAMFPDAASRPPSAWFQSCVFSGSTVTGGGAPPHDVATFPEARVYATLPGPVLWDVELEAASPGPWPLVATASAGPEGRAFNTSAFLGESDPWLQVRGAARMGFGRTP